MEIQAKYYLHKSLCYVSGDMQRRRPQGLSVVRKDFYEFFFLVKFCKIHISYTYIAKSPYETREIIRNFGEMIPTKWQIYHPEKICNCDFAKKNICIT